MQPSILGCTWRCPFCHGVVNIRLQQVTAPSATAGFTTIPVPNHTMAASDITPVAS
jgi:pyruvate-formate lyase-activating enzyme